MEFKFNIFALLILNSTFLILNSSKAQYTENYAGSFNGTNSYVAVPNSSGFSPTGAITLEAWVYPTQLLATTMAVIGKNYQSSYFLGIQTSGRIAFYPKGGLSFRSRVTGVVPVNKWTHIAGTYDGTNTRIYINGTLDTSSTAFTGSVGVNSDSLFIGADRIGAATSLFFRGRLDNVRIWGIGRSASQISENKTSPLEIIHPTGAYSGLRGSFQLDNNALNYGGSELNIGYSRNITFIDYRNEAVNYLDYNNNLVVNGTTDHFSSSNSTSLNLTNAITLEAWIRRDTTGTQPLVQNIVNKSGGTSRYNYALYINSSGTLSFDINSGSFTVSSSPVITNSRWTHIAATYSTVDGYAILYVNGIYQTSALFTGHPLIQNDPDKLFIGGIGATAYAANKFKGQIDGVRIWKVIRTPDQLRDNMYKSVLDNNVVNYDFDKYTNAIRNGNSVILSGGVFTGSAHISSAQTNFANQSSSPILFDDAGGFYSQNYFNNYRGFFVPDNNSNGIKDSIFISSPGSILNLRAYVLMSHTYVADIGLNLISPQGTSILLFNHNGGSGNDMMTIFSDAADSLPSSGTEVNGRGIIPPFSPSVKPIQALSAFNGQNQLGWWKIKCVDNVGGDRGYVNSWGLKITSGIFYRTLRLTTLIQGFYNDISDKMIKDTAKVFLRNVNSPYAILDTAKGILDSNGKGSFIFDNISGSDVFHIVVTHRNSIETWSSAGYNFTSDTLQYNFTLAASQAYQSNQIQVDSSPAKFAVYSGDVNQDGIIDINDNELIDNDAFNFATGYLKTDVNGDGPVDIADATIADNNAFNFVSVIRP